MAPKAAPADVGRAGKSFPVPPRKIVDAIKDATGASEEDISAMLAECNYDVNEATTRLVESELGINRVCCSMGPDARRA